VRGDVGPGENGEVAVFVFEAGVVPEGGDLPQQPKRAGGGVWVGPLAGHFGSGAALDAGPTKGKAGARSPRGWTSG